ncbi:muscular LMNA-interacting protein-like isoform X7 [Polyodon spathula]|uniref:muscular LMNA-interacting protein-like isoform X7 n=1 Tax=Polyodon spathula TaxID=7913 RepID=UPI001B7DCDA9|nr:muscular LMNA-interacting protein-like isoform X7 [Polyodon spathula]
MQFIRDSPQRQRLTLPYSIYIEINVDRSLELLYGLSCQLTGDCYEKRNLLNIRILKEHPTQPLSFTFVPVVRKLPTHAYVHSGNCGQPKCKPNEHFGTQEEMASDMLQHDIFKAEIVFIGDSEDEGEDAPAHHHCLEQTNDIARIEPQLQEYKIKSSYKAFAAIPSNILLLEQKAIDEEVDNPVGAPVEDNKVSETHAEMCSPAQLRQQSEELYATIDQVLEEPMPMQRSHSVPISLQKLMDSDAPKNFTTLPRSAGRETKYATSHLLPSGFAEKQLTKPGVIRPVAVIAREKEKHQPNPFRQYLEETSDAEQRLSLSPSFLTSFVSHPTFYHHLCQTILSPRNISLSKPLSFSSVKCLTPGPYIHLSSIIQPNYQTNLPLSLGSLYNKPQHPIVTIHENEALSSKELNTVRGLSRTDATGCPGIPKMRLQDRPDEHSHVLLQIREEEEEEEDEKVNSSSTA